MSDVLQLLSYSLTQGAISKSIRRSTSIRRRMNVEISTILLDIEKTLEEALKNDVDISMSFRRSIDVEKSTVPLGI